MSCSPTDPCNQPSHSSDSIVYTGPGLPCTDIDPCDTITEAFQKAEAKVCVLQSTVINLQNQLNSLTTTTSTSSTSTTSTSSTSTTSTTTSGVSLLCFRPKYQASPIQVSVMFRKNGGPWTMLIYEPSPGNTFTQFQVGNLIYNCALLLSSTNINPVIGDFIELYVVTGVGLQNVRFGNGYVNPPSIVGDFTSNCGQAAPFGFIYTPTQRYINVDSTEPVFPAVSGTILTC